MRIRSGTPGRAHNPDAAEGCLHGVGEVSV
jgi:hypothetical protein